MKIIHFIYDSIYNPWVGGGGAIRAFELNKRLAQKGHKILLISGNYPGAKEVRQKNFCLKFLGNPNNYILSTFSYALQAHTFLKKNYKNFDIIIEDFAPWNPIFSYKYKKEKPIILQLHQREKFNILKRYLFLGIPFLLLEKFYPLQYQPNIIFVSKKCKNNFNLKGEILSNGIDSSYLNFSIRQGKYILFIGRIDIFHKGLDILLKSIANLNLKVILAGKGKDENKILKRIKKLKLKNVEYIGFVFGKTKKNILGNCNFLVMPSRYEGQPLTVFEAAAMGKPIIVSDIPELSFVEENGFGISFRNGDAKDLKDKIEFLWNNSDLIKEMGEKGKNFAKNFTWDNIAKQYEDYLFTIYKKSKSC